MANKTLTKNQLRRLPDYLSLLKNYQTDGIRYVNCQLVADDLNLNQEQVRKDIAAVASTNGVPNKGRDLNILIWDIEQVLGYDDIHNAILIGVGNLGTALLKYQGFGEFGLKIIGAFDSQENKVGERINGVRINSIDRLEATFMDYNAKIGIIAVPKEYAQDICNRLIKCGIQAIWNFAPTNLYIENKEVILSNMNMANSLAVLSYQLFLKKKNKENELKKNKRRV